MKRHIVYGVGPFRNVYTKSWFIAHVKAFVFNFWFNVCRYRVEVRNA